MNRSLPNNLMNKLGDIAGARNKNLEIETVPPPHLEDFVVKVEAPREPSQEEILQTIEQLLFDSAQYEERPQAYVIEWGDEVLVDLTAYREGRVLPFSARNDVWLTSLNDAQLPGLRQELIGQTAGVSKVARVTLSRDEENGEWAGKTVVYAAHIKSVRTPTFPEFSDRSLLESVEVGSVDELLIGTRCVLIACRQREHEHQICQAVVAELDRRLGPVPISDQVVNAELEYRWHNTEGLRLRERDVPINEQVRARQQFVEDRGLRTQIVQGLRATVALGSLAIAHGLVPNREELEEILLSEGAKLGVSSEALAASTREEPLMAGRMVQAIVIERAFQFVMERVKVETV